MPETIEMSVSLPPDDEGMVGRECPSCHKYFKIKPGTGLETSDHICPYCEHAGASQDFLTQAQLKFGESYAIQQVVGPLLREMEDTFRKLERDTRHSLVRFTLKSSGLDLPLEYYREEDLETSVVCDMCDLEFAIYGVFASCPDCGRLNSMAIFRTSILAAGKRLDLLDRIPDAEEDIRGRIVADAVVNGVSAFDGLGKRLKDEFPGVFPPRPRNLFQNIDVLVDSLREFLGLDLARFLGTERFGQLFYLFQVRHIWAHNFGEADESFLSKTNSAPSLLGTRIVPTERDVRSFLASIEEVALEIRSRAHDA